MGGGGASVDFCAILLAFLSSIDPAEWPKACLLNRGLDGIFVVFS